ncbi:hypothetical protein BJ875DRAFT_201861 [Amylocarpus encephaloides]|uniref:CENP-V/GFA domain-containing protein n=1 Tax=Amylocarpus encephaloides TaxID=45428 RepID=A0A9P8C7K8_9HELO|nr:hypothetical protein BJ875DRAFT_201861 [Amylocarpus encephaloides]
MATTTQQTSTTTTPTRRPYRGSCHCGLTKYIVFITLPPVDPVPIPDSSKTVRIRKCNCSTCHKMGLTHVRVPASHNDFLLLSPTTLFDGGLRDYKCFEAEIHWPYCGTCGVRCFAWSGEGELKEMEVGGEKLKGWGKKSGEWNEDGSKGEGGYLSINAITIEPGQEGFDMREWHEKGWIAYLEMQKHLDNIDPRMGTPYPGGMY